MSGKKSARRSYEERSKDKFEDIKGELKKLRKEVLQLRKENAKLRGRDMELKDFFEEMQTEKEQEIVIENKCPKCGSKQVKIIEKLMHDKDYFFCENPHCGARGPK